jgi:hypothetical protein
MGWGRDATSWTTDARRRGDCRRPARRDRSGQRTAQSGQWAPIWVVQAVAAAHTSLVLGVMTNYAATVRGHRFAHMSLVRLLFPSVVEVLKLLRCC